MTTPTPTKIRVQELLNYLPDSGNFTWKISLGRCRRDTKAGNPNHSGYWRISIDTRYCFEHQLVWLMEHGEWPATNLDHIDGNRSRNVISNLRLANKSENAQNIRQTRKDSITGFLGVKKQRNAWLARIQVDGKREHLGSFNSPEEAA